MALCLSALLALLAAPAVMAAEHPPVIPQRDVDVTYAMASPKDGAPPLTQRMRWSVASGRLRVDPPTGGLYMIVDYRAKRMAVVKPSDRAVLDVSTNGPGLPGAAGGDYVRRAPGQVAGLACTDWQTADAAGQPTVICLTADGVMLRASQAGNVLLEATAVAYGPQDPAAFVPPEGFRHVSGDRP
jgi:hypothetical protein